MADGKFIVIEGLDGSGKGTQITLLENKLREMGVSLHRTCEPTEHATGGLIRDALCGMTKRTPCELASLFLADRISHCSNPVSGIKKLIENGVTVICDRYYYSSFAYQGMDTDLKWVMDQNLNCPDILQPDLCIFLDVPPAECDARIEKGRAQREIYESGVETITRIRDKYVEVFSLLDGHNIAIINASRKPEEVAKDVLEAVKRIIR
ncbi:MAG: dTMP kinase [Oscillospiraceae bacterium]|nr:dTMP kinase [Oscillospiraceae bacterium]